VFGSFTGAMRLFVGNRRDGSRLLSSAIATAVVGFVRFDSPWGQAVALGATALSVWWWICYRQLSH
jgi:hypothetical protein